MTKNETLMSNKYKAEKKPYDDFLTEKGVEVVRARLMSIPDRYKALSDWDIPKYGSITRVNAEEWLRRQDLAISARDAQRYRIMLLWTIASAISASLAAILSAIPLLFPHK